MQILSTTELFDLGVMKLARYLNFKTSGEIAFGFKVFCLISKLEIQSDKLLFANFWSTIMKSVVIVRAGAEQWSYLKSAIL